MTAFDSGAWLDRFAAAGGWHADDGSKVWFGWRLDTVEQAAAARGIWHEVEGDVDRRARVVVHVRTHRPLMLILAD